MATGFCSCQYLDQPVSTAMTRCVSEGGKWDFLAEVCLRELGGGLLLFRLLPSFRGRVLGRRRKWVPVA